MMLYVLAPTPWPERGGIMTIGIAPTRPETQYGYIERGDGEGPVYDVTRFREKPDLQTAEGFLRSGRFFWNGGIFMFRAGEMAAELARQQPEVWTQASRAVERADVEGKCCRLDAEAFAASPKISIDYAVMENAPRIGVVAASFDWNDLGSWNQLHDGSPHDQAGNARFGDVLAIDVKNSYLRSEDRLLAVAGSRQHHRRVATRRAADRPSRQVASGQGHRRSGQAERRMAAARSRPFRQAGALATGDSQVAVRHRAAALGRRRRRPRSRRRA
jgi:mannose-1-phosphate guanylyltransferase